MIPFTKPPNFLYKYLPFNKKTISSLINQQFWFSAPETFNDPHDCRIKFDFSITVDKLKEHLNKTNKFHTEVFKNINNPTEQRRWLNDLGIHHEQDEFLAIANRVYVNGGYLRGKNEINKVIEEFENSPMTVIERAQKESLKTVKQFRIFCLCKTKNNATMWAHYADNHKGICVKFQVSKDNEFFNFPIKVEYKTQYPNYNYFNEWDNHNAFFVMASTKSTNWKYEKEYRIMKDKTKFNFINEGLYKIKKEAIIEVNFGLSAKDEDIQLFNEINQKFYDNKIKLYKAIEKDQTFNLGFVKVN